VYIYGDYKILDASGHAVPCKRKAVELLR
jgi:hypothetical protein